MLHNPTKEEVLQAISDYAEKCVDIPVTSFQVVPFIDGDSICMKSVDITNNTQIPLSPAAESQLLSRLTVPVAFFHRCPTQLRRDIVTHFNLSKEHDYLFRCLNTEEQNVFRARAVLSSIFTREYDDKFTFPVVLAAIPEDLRLSSFVKYDDITRLESQFAGPVSHDGHTAQPGVMITNSETGRSSLWVEPVVIVDNRYRLASRKHCGAVHGEFRFVHRGGGVSQERILASITQAQTAAQVGAIEYLRLTTEEVASKKAIEFIESIDALPKRFTDMMEEEWQNQQRLSKVTVMKKILDAAVDLPIVNQILIEQAVGSWSNIFHDYNERILSMAEDIRWLQEQQNVTISS